ncbi:hypothetical protein OSB04_031523 [Centaurea solstitialis]|uniref:Uncharacterized protein n=1 Tax=Centaurea solstitialis TaxID=347529 RepID=A0AA38W4T9_9ASTR|nr:hypothetical protein OSB04_031523 [Centaurea solstitialis]
MGKPRMDVAKVHEDILDSLEPKPATEVMDSDWINELGDLSCPECDSQDICVHSLNVDQMNIGLPNAPEKLRSSELPFGGRNCMKHQWRAMLKHGETSLVLARSRLAVLPIFRRPVGQRAEDPDVGKYVRAGVLVFGGSWDTYLPLAEISYRSSIHPSIEMQSYEML